MRTTLFKTGFSLGLLQTVHALTGATCTVNAIQNPSFETGDLTDWTNYIAEAGIAGGYVVSGEASDGSDYFTISFDNNDWTYLEQSVSGLETGTQYTVSVDFQYIYNADIQASDSPGNCFIGFSTGSWSNFITFEKVYPTFQDGSLIEWTNYALPLTASASTIDLYVMFACEDPNQASLNLDNVMLSLGTRACPSASSSTSSSASSVSPTPSPVKINRCKPQATSAQHTVTHIPA
ncbi:hypothetical protein SBRCBS47491_007204 [Sporothrix bragantina]|uniref:CBM-cenC domain-containing protein n=1 Tax=Sporothrix bragantina TaxID=671064 RepID=A0ABP0CBN6_9PEZI